MQFPARGYCKYIERMLELLGITDTSLDWRKCESWAPYWGGGGTIDYKQLRGFNAETGWRDFLEYLKPNCHISETARINTILPCRM